MALMRDELERAGVTHAVRLADNLPLVLGDRVLSISRSIVEAHGGRMQARPNEPHGAIFEFSLPLAQA